MNDEDLNRMKVPELRAELQTRGLDTKGIKAVLIERLRDALQGEGEGGGITATEVNEDEDQQPETEDVDRTHEDEDEKDEEAKLVYEEEDDAEDHPLDNGEKAQDESLNDVPIKEENDDDDDDYTKKVDYEEAPMEAVDDVKKEHEEEEQRTVKKEPAEVKHERETEVKTETEDDRDKRGRKRHHSSTEEDATADSGSKRSRPDVEEVRIEDEPDFDKTIVALDWYNSDLSLIIDKDNMLKATPMVAGGFAYVWHGVRSTYGAVKGKIFYEVRVEEHLNIGSLEQEEQHPFVIRCGVSVDDAGLTLGEEPLSYGYGGTGKASTNLKFKDYGKTFGKGDVVGCYLDMDSAPFTMSFTVNGEHQGICYEITRSELGESALFPHILTKNCTFSANFGSEDAWFEPLPGYTFIGHIPTEELVQGTQGPEKRDNAEIIMMVGLPAAGKTTWVEQYCKENPEKKYNVLGTNNLIDKMKVMGLPRKRNYAGRWENLIDKCTKCLNKLLHVGTKRRRNFIIDQTNVYPSAQKRKIKGFAGFKRRAVVIFPTDEDLKIRTQKREKEEGKDVPDKAVLEMKANFKLPEVGEFFESVEYIEMESDEAMELLKQYNKEGEKAGFGPKNYYGGGNQQGKRVGYVDRRGKYNNRGGGGYRGGWDRDRDRRGGFDKRDRGGWNRDRDNNRDRYRDNRSGGGSGGSGGGGGFNRDRGNRGSSGGGWQGGYRGNNQKQSTTWGTTQGTQDYGTNQWGAQSYGNNQGWGTQGYNAGYNWNQQYYGAQQQTPAQQPSYWNQGYGAQTGYNTQGTYGAQTGYAQSGYGYGQQAIAQQQQQQQQWSGYGSGYSGNTGYQSSTHQYNRK